VAEPAPARDVAGVIAPPPLLFALFLAIGLLLDWLLPGRLWPIALAWPWRLAAGLVPILAGALLAIAAERRFRAVGTDVRPWRPSTALASGGPYRFTRNPMYLGLLLLLAGIAIAADGPWLMAQLLPLWLLLHFGVVRREEAYLEEKFGEPYRDYCRRVRRWL
jgi:protein-S-isoprenylcysteine O-methyltransferase Ste14